MTRAEEDSPLTIKRLRLLVALAEHGSVTAAARAGRMSQPALSQNLRVLERHFGIPLTIKVGRRIVLTNLARMIVEYARRVLRLVEESEAAVRETIGLRRGRVAIGASTTPGTYLLPRLLGEFRARHPEIELVLRIGDTREVEEWVLRGAVDFGVIGETSEQLGLVVTPFRRDELVVVTPAVHPLGFKARIDAEALAAQPLIVRERGSSTREVLERALAAHGHSLNVLFELGSTEAILQAVMAGLGPSVVSELAVTEPRQARVRRVAGLDLTRYLAVVVHPDARLAPAASQFRAELTRGAEPPVPVPAS